MNRFNKNKKYYQNEKPNPEDYEFNLDEFGKVHKAKKVKDNSMVRFKFLEFFYRRWNRSRMDTR